MELRYLLILNVNEEGYWDTSGYCEWRKPARHATQEFTFDDDGRDRLIQTAGRFIHERPKGTYFIYIIDPSMELDKEHELIKEYRLGLDLEEKKKLAEKQRQVKETENRKAVERDLKLLAELKARYES
jgi:hypothetical protein